MTWLQIIKHDAVTADRFRIQITVQEVFQHQRVLWCIGLVTQHGLHFCIRTAIVSLMVSAEGTLEHILTDKYRFVSAIRARNLHYDEVHSVVFQTVYMMLQKDIGADFLTVVQRVPDIRKHLLRIYYATRNELFRDLIFLDTENNRTAKGVGK